jgi:hemolysin III
MPLLRGRIHVAALLAAIPGGIALVVRAGPAPARVGATVYSITLVTLFAASSAYHRLGRTPKLRSVLRRLDHSSIYLLIAGSYTPLCLVVLRGWVGPALLAAVWTAAIVGVVLKLGWFDRFSRVGGALYIVMGWAAVIAAPALLDGLSTRSIVLLVAGGVLFTGGAIVLATRTPDPLPRIFGYHEVWHTLVVAAASLHYLVISDVLRV